MAKRIRKAERLSADRPAALGELIHAQVRVAIEAAVHEELAIALGAGRDERHGERRGYRNGVKPRTLTGPTGPLALTLPRATLVAPAREERRQHERPPPSLTRCWAPSPLMSAPAPS
jgi:transposase-like protein